MVAAAAVHGKRSLALSSGSGYDTHCAMKITDLRLVPLRVVQDMGTLAPAWEPGAVMQFARGGGALLEIHTDEGLVGIGPAAKGRVLEVARSMLLGQDPSDVEFHFERMRFSMRDQRGAAAVDIALWDLRAKVAKQPLHRLLGSERDRVPAYASMVLLSSPSERALLAEALVEQGFRALKLRLHFDTLRGDVETVARVRAAVGPDVTILCDANQAQSPGEWQPGVRWDYARALQTARELNELGVGWLEEPLPRYAYTELARLCDETDLPIAGGENLRLQEFGPLLQHHAYDIVQPDAMVVDGLTGLRRVFELARLHGTGIAPHHGGRGIGTIAHMHAVAAAPDVPFVEVLHDPPIGDFAHGFAMLRNPPVLDAVGNFVLPTGDGLGLDVDPDFHDRTGKSPGPY